MTEETRTDIHIPVLLHTVLDGLQIARGDVVLDGTLGGGGYSVAALDQEPTITLIGLDVDAEAILRARAQIERRPGTHHILEANFRNIDTVCKDLDIKHIDKAMFDLGLSSFQLDGMTGTPRGMSFKRNEPLVMTLSGKSDGLTAEEIVNSWQEESIADIIYGYGEERYARRIAKEIVEARESSRITTTNELVAIIKNAVPSRYLHGRIHPATRTFQALRITVNDELGALKEGLQKTYDLLAPDGRMAVVSFHSLEDRIVKHFFRGSGGTVITKKPITPDEDEIAQNPRARSAKLRILQK